MILRHVFPVAVGVWGAVLVALAGSRLGPETVRQVDLVALSAHLDPGPMSEAQALEVARRAARAAVRVGDAEALEDGASLLAKVASAVTDAGSRNHLLKEIAALSSQALAVSPSRAESRLLLAAALAETGRSPEEVRPHLERAAALDPHRPDRRRRIGLVFLALGEPRLATAEFQTALRLDPELGPAIFGALSTAGDELTPEMVTPRTAAALLALGSWLDERSRWSEADAALEQAYALASDEPATRAEAYNRLQRSHFRAGRATLAERLARRRLAEASLPVDPAASAWADLARALLHQGRAEEALAAWSQATQLRRDDLEMLLGRADALLALGREEDALSAWREVAGWAGAAQDRRLDAVRLRLAEHLKDGGRFAEALLYLKQVLAHDPDNHQALELAGAISGG